VTLFDGDPVAALKHHFGFEAFRPLQAEIVADVLAGNDVFALLPTGGGKSLCYQLPAMMLPGLTVVVSPLIALMKDQVDALRLNGLPATFLNSTLPAQDVERRTARLRAGEYRLLYVAPERLRSPGFLDALASFGVSRFAIDEAHCISAWGHDFRPEYRQLAAVRRRFAGVPFLALTATATERVRADVLEQLALRTPRCYVASFNRPNLTYLVEPKRPAQAAFARLLAFVRERAGQSGIVYCATRRTAETLAARLRSSGVEALPYHAGLEARTRSRHQDLFRRDEVPLICATIAFGMGIDKPNVRFVVHYDLPKNLEGYYQETGRAGRDGLPSDCFLLYAAADAVKQRHFIAVMSDEREQAIAQQQLAQMMAYAEADACRRAILLSYFGEAVPDGPCGACDNCVAPRQRFDGTLLARKLLSCVVRIREACGFGAGLNHVADVLVGRNTKKVRDWNHDAISTFGIGRDRPHAAWVDVGNELLRLGLLRRSPAGHGAVELTDSGREALFGRRDVLLVSAAPVAPSPATERSARAPRETAEDAGLFERLRTLRRTLAEARGVPAYVVFPDATLREMVRVRPHDRAALRAIGGVGDTKLAAFGDAFLAAIAGEAV
jgi:ATP-dependent DNA helicase RecQ